MGKMQQPSFPVSVLTESPIPCTRWSTKGVAGKGGKSVHTCFEVLPCRVSSHPRSRNSIARTRPFGAVIHAMISNSIFHWKRTMIQRRRRLSSYVLLKELARSINEQIEHRKAHAGQFWVSARPILGWRSDGYRSFHANGAREQNHECRLAASGSFRFGCIGTTGRHE